MLSGNARLAVRRTLDPSLLTGVPAIDEEHQQLVGQFEAISENQHAHPRSEIFSEILSRLGRQISEHFDNEELVLKHLGMPSDLVASHAQAHIDILDQYARLNLALMQGQALDRCDVVPMIKGWIVDHVLNFDVKVRDYLPQPGASGSE